MSAAGSEVVRFECLYEQYFDRVGAYLLARADRDTAAEALAATFEVAWRRIASVPAEPLPWQLGVARKVLADARRSSRREAALVERMSATISAGSSDTADDVVAREVLIAAISALTPVQREALLLIVWDGLSQRETATVLGCTRAAVAVRVYRARASLRAALRRANDNARPGGAQPTNARSAPATGGTGGPPLRPSRITAFAA